jgi:hypothetical protein
LPDLKLPALPSLGGFSKISANPEQAIKGFLDFALKVSARWRVQGREPVKFLARQDTDLKHVLGLQRSSSLLLGANGRAFHPALLSCASTLGCSRYAMQGSNARHPALLPGAHPQRRRGRW